MARERSLVLLSCLLLPVLGCGFLYASLGGDFREPPGAMQGALGPGARALVERAFQGLGSAPLVDHHVHLMALEHNAKWLSPWRPLRRARAMVYLHAAGIAKASDREEAYLGRLVELARAFPAPIRLYVLAMDRHHRPDGSIDAAHTEWYVPSESAVELARAYPELLVPVVSVHPQRADALDALERWHAEGVRHVKWLPNSMGIDPASPANDAYYRKLGELGMVLLTHTGAELAVGAADPDFGNPLRLRRPLALGVTVVAYHAASDGDDVDWDDPERRRVPSFDLLMRLLSDPAYRGRLFAEISAITFFNHLDRPLRELLARPELHPRLVNGSDYPFCALDVVVQTSKLASHGFLSESEARQLDEIYRYNPLLFDFVVKRTVRHPETGARFAPEVFSGRDLLYSSQRIWSRDQRSSQPASRSAGRSGGASRRASRRSSPSRAASIGAAAAASRQRASSAASERWKIANSLRQTSAVRASPPLRQASSPGSPPSSMRFQSGSTDSTTGTSRAAGTSRKRRPAGAAACSRSRLRESGSASASSKTSTRAHSRRARSASAPSCRESGWEARKPGSARPSSRSEKCAGGCASR